jgi:hypothetical protein
MAIPRASIPQASMQQAQPLLAQFNAARAAAQGQQMPVIQGRGIDPAQLMQMAQGNALQIRNQLNGQANQFIATDPAVDIRARERYLESLEKDTQAANRADSRAIFNADRNDARTIYTTENAKDAAALLAQQTENRLDRDIESRNKNTDRRIEADNKLQDRKDAAFEREKNFQLEIADYKDGLARQLRIDQQDAERLEKEALQGKFGGFYADELNKINQYWGEPGKPGQRFQQIQGFKKEYLSSGVLQDPDLYNRFATTSPVYKKFQQALGLKEGEAIPLTTPGIQQALYEYAMDEIDAGGPLSVGFQKKYQSAIIQQDTAARQTYSNIINEAIKRGIIPQRGGAQPTSVPGGVQVQGGNGVGGVQPGGNALAPSVPVAPGAPAPQALIQPTDTGNEYGQFDDAFFNKLSELGNQGSTTDPPPPEEESSVDPLTTAILTSTGGVVTNEALRKTPVDVDNEFKKATPDQADSDKAIRSTYDQIEETQKQKEAIRGADEKLQGDNEKINRSKALAEKNIATAQSQINELEKEQASLKEKIQKKGTKYNKLEAKIKAYGKYSYTEQQEFKKQRKAIQDDMQKLLEEMVEKDETINAKKQGITRKQELLKELDKSSRSRRAIRNQEVGAIRKDPSMRSTNISNQRSTVNADPDLKETAQRQGKLNALIRQKGMNPDDFRMSNGLLDEAAMRDHIGAKKEFAITKLARRFPDLAKRIAGLAKGRIGSNLLIATITGGTAYALLSREDKKEAETQLKEVKDLEEIEAELNATQSTQPNALQPAQ